MILDVAVGSSLVAPETIGREEEGGALGVVGAELLGDDRGVCFLRQDELPWSVAVEEAGSNVLFDIGTTNETVIVRAIDVESSEVVDVGDGLAIAPFLGEFSLLFGGEVLVEEVGGAVKLVL